MCLRGVGAGEGVTGEREQQAQSIEGWLLRSQGGVPVTGFAYCQSTDCRIFALWFLTLQSCGGTLNSADTGTTRPPALQWHLMSDVRLHRFWPNLIQTFVHSLTPDRTRLFPLNDWQDEPVYREQPFVRGLLSAAAFFSEAATDAAGLRMPKLALWAGIARGLYRSIPTRSEADVGFAFLFVPGQRLLWRTCMTYLFFLSVGVYGRAGLQLNDCENCHGSQSNRWLCLLSSFFLLFFAFGLLLCEPMFLDMFICVSVLTAEITTDLFTASRIPLAWHADGSVSVTFFRNTWSTPSETSTTTQPPVQWGGVSGQGLFPADHQQADVGSFWLWYHDAYVTRAARSYGSLTNIPLFNGLQIERPRATSRNAAWLPCLGNCGDAASTIRTCFVHLFSLLFSSSFRCARLCLSICVCLHYILDLCFGSLLALQCNFIRIFSCG